MPKLLLDTCSIINLSYCAPVATAFRIRYEGSAGWTQAANWAAMWLGAPIEITDEELLIAIARIQHDIAGGGTDSALDHLGEAASIALLESTGSGRLISDDHAARDEARRRGARASSTVGVIAQLLTIDGSGIDAAMADTYLEILQTRGRMHVPLKSIDLLMGDLGPWQ